MRVDFIAANEPGKIPLGHYDLPYSSLDLAHASEGIAGSNNAEWGAQGMQAVGRDLTAVWRFEWAGQGTMIGFG